MRTWGAREDAGVDTVRGVGMNRRGDEDAFGDVGTAGAHGESADGDDKRRGSDDCRGCCQYD